MNEPVESAASGPHDLVAAEVVLETILPEAPLAAEAAVAAPLDPPPAPLVEGATPEPAAPAAQSAPAELSPRQRARIASLYRALRSGRDIEGTVEQVIKGGYQVRVGGVRGFCPHSQIEVHREDEPERHLGKTYRFRVTQVRHGGADVVVSRRAVLLAERVDEAKAVRATLIEGAITRGRVAGTADFGAFVDLGAGVMGLVHVSELAHHRVIRVDDAVHTGDVVSVKVLKLHEDGRRISLSIRQAIADPWDDVAQRFVRGCTYPGAVRRLADFGAFVELAPGIEALAPASEFPPSREGWRNGLAPDVHADWLVLAVDPLHRRITLTAPLEDHPLDAPLPEVGAALRGRVQRVESFGVFVWLGPGRSGLIPSALSGVPRGTDLASRYAVGDEVEVEVVEVEPVAQKIRLARKGARVAPLVAPRPPARPREVAPKEPPRARAPRESPPPPRPAVLQPPTFGTSLADKLRAALAEPRRS